MSICSMYIVISKQNVGRKRGGECYFEYKDFTVQQENNFMKSISNKQRSANSITDRP